MQHPSLTDLGLRGGRRFQGVQAGPHDRFLHVPSANDSLLARY